MKKRKKVIVVHDVSGRTVNKKQAMNYVNKVYLLHVAVFFRLVTSQSRKL